MLNLLRMNLYRMVHTRSLLVLLLTAVLFAGFNSYMATLDLEELAAQAPADSDANGIQVMAATPEEPSATNFGIYVNVPDMENGRPAPFIKYFCADISSRIILIFLIIAAALFVSGEFKSGFIKNIAGQTGQRWQIYLAKLITYALYQLVLILAYGTAQYIMLKIYYGSELTFGIDVINSTLLLFLAGQFLLYFAFISGITMLTAILHSTAFAISFGLLSCFGFGAIAAGWIQKLTDFDISPYYLVSNMETVSLEMSTKTAQSALLAGAVYLIVYTLIGCLYLTKKDVV